MLRHLPAHLRGQMAAEACRLRAAMGLALHEADERGLPEFCDPFIPDRERPATLDREAARHFCTLATFDLRRTADPQMEYEDTVWAGTDGIINTIRSRTVPAEEWAHEQILRWNRRACEILAPMYR